MLNLRAGCFLFALLLSQAALAKTPFSFGVARDIYPAGANDTVLLRILYQTEKEPLSFLVINGIKGAHEDCSDQLYANRLSALNLAKLPVILSLTGNDWISCMGKDMHESTANERLQRIRDLFYGNNTSLGIPSLHPIQESNNPEFRAYAENMQWESNHILFATLNVPVPDNHFIMRGGQNSEFEDRQVANREWLRRLFILAKARKAQGIVIFTDADIFTHPSSHLFSLREMPDGFEQVRKTVVTLSEQFTGHVLLISNQASNKKGSLSNITWHKRLGHINTNATWLKVTVDDKSKMLFTIKKEQIISRDELLSDYAKSIEKAKDKMPQATDLATPVINGK